MLPDGVADAVRFAGPEALGRERVQRGDGPTARLRRPGQRQRQQGQDAREHQSMEHGANLPDRID
jgi:hypothetical protein